MTLEEFLESAAHEDAPPVSLSQALQALWHAERGEWEQAHRIAQDDGSRNGSWVHANLHREEGDIGNAGYWYARAGKEMPDTTVVEERRALIAVLLRSA